MKKTLLTVAAVMALGATGALAQGSIQFNNFTSGAVTYGAGYAGAVFNVSIYWQAGTVGGTSDAFIQGATYYGVNADMFGAGPALEADQSNGAGFFDGGVIAVPGAAAAGTYTFVVVAYDGLDYASSLVRGASNPFQVNLVTGATPPGSMTMPTFSVAPIPEPSTFALAGLGLASLLIFRRRK